MIDRLAETGNTMKRQAEPQFDMDEFEDEIITSNQNYHYMNIKFEGYDYDGAFRIVKLSVNLNGLQEHHFDYLEDQIIESIGLRINKRNIVLETKPEYV